MYRVGLFGGFDLSDERGNVKIPADSQRLVAFLALHHTSIERGYVAGRLWSDYDEERARANLRSTLWRLRRCVSDLVVADVTNLSLGPEVSADVRDLERRADELRQPVADTSHDSIGLDHRLFSLPFLPGWYEEWVLVERERVQQLCLHCLESIAAALIQRREFGAAIQTLLTAIALDPLRESPRRQLVDVHLATGNYSEAIRQYDEFAKILDRELGLQPSPHMRTQLERCGSR